MNNNIKLLRENILSALPLSMAKKYERMNRNLNSDKESEQFFKYDDYGNYSEWAFEGVKSVRDTYYDYTYEI